MFWIRASLVIGVAALGGCATWSDTPRCPAGQQRVEQQCLPTPTIVFERCLESFRKTNVERDHSATTNVQAKAGAYGGSLQRSKMDRETEAYRTLPDDVIPEAIAECRRQEETERQQQLAKATAELEAAKRDVSEAREAEKKAQAEAESLAAARVSLETALEERDGQLLAIQEELVTERETLAEHHPCTAQVWDRCGEQGERALEEGEYRRAHRLFAQACEGGHGASCAKRGSMLEQGLGSAPSDAGAYAQYDRGCGLGSADACTSAASMLEQGRGVAADRARAGTLYKESCKSGVMRACARLGRLRERGDLGEPAPDRAAKLYRRACDGGELPACTWLGDLHNEGRGVRRDPGRAVNLYRRACDGGVSDACVRLSYDPDDEF